ncbi:MAG: hypothetical protein KatS3mg110_1199 [Pirellulaceae bacterium]|nr:MAG: hypothetical protein KatS3mg110_1199 [Pirellulaceae bacterium]
MHRSEAVSPVRSALSIKRPAATPSAGRVFQAAWEAAWWWLVGLTWLAAALAWAHRLVPLADWAGLLLWAAALGGALLVRWQEAFLPRRVRFSAAVLPLGVWLTLLGSGTPRLHAIAELVVMIALEILWWTGGDPKAWPWGFRSFGAPSRLRLAGERTGSICQSVPADTLHQVVRFLDHGTDTIWAQWKLDYPADTQRLVVHLPICPPLDAVPHDVESAWQGDVPGSCRVTQVEVYGVRVEVRFGKPVVQPGSGRLDVVVRASPTLADPAPNG